MAVYNCKQVKITIPTGEELTLLNTIQSFGHFEIIENKESNSLSGSYLDNETEIVEHLDIVNKAIDVLEVNQPKKGPLAAVTDDRVILSKAKLTEFESGKEKIIQLAHAIHEKTARRQELVELEEELKETIHKVTPFKDIDIDLFGNFKYVEFVPFFINSARMEHVMLELEKKFSDIVLESIGKVEDEYVYIAAVTKSKKSEIISYLAENASIISIQTSVEGSFKDVYSKSIKQHSEIKKELQNIEQFLLKGSSHYTKLLVLKDILKSDLDKIFALHAFQEAENGKIFIEGWVDPSQIDTFKAILKKHNSTSNLEIVSQGNDVKVVLRNNKFFRNFEIITKTMGIPLGNSIDPTPVLTIFFLLMFGLALSEAGYALIVILMIAPLLFFTRVKDNVKSIFWVLFYSSISTVIIGALFGSWFGVTPKDVVTNAPELFKAQPHMNLLIDSGIIGFLQKLQVINPLQQIIFLMIAMGILGVIHLYTGLILNFVQHAKRGQLLEGAYASLSWVFLLTLFILWVLAGQGALGASLQQNSQLIGYLLLGYAFSMIFIVGREANSILGKFGKGAFDMFFGVIGYLADILSYTRLVALGLATGIIAAVVNTLALLAGGSLVEKGGVYLLIGYAIMLIIFVIGHVFNIALNVLGAYITVGRLHFVEFFSKFFEVGGQELVPFKKSEEFIKITT